MKTLFKLTTALGNTSLLIWTIYLLVEDGINDAGLVVFAIAVLMALNLYFLFFTSKENDWFSLFLKRKALEEQKKIQSLG